LQADKGITVIYKTVNRLLSRGSAVIYAIEERGGGGIDKNASKIQLINHIYSKMKQSQLIDDIESHIESGALTIADARELYPPSPSEQVDNAKMLKRWISLIQTVEKKGNFRDIAVICGRVAVFSDANNLENLIAYERAISESIKKLRSVRILCCYLKESLDRFQFAQLMSTINAHQCAIGCIEDSEESRKMDPAVMLEAIVGGIEDALGEGSGKLVMQTMKTVYRIDENTIISNPNLFQEKMQRLLGNTSKIVLDSANRRIRETLLMGGLSMIMATVFSSAVPV
jgi:hypothetical protein